MYPTRDYTSNFRETESRFINFSEVLGIHIHIYISATNVKIVLSIHINSYIYINLYMYCIWNT